MCFFKIVLLLLGVLCPFLALAQLPNITAMEYFVDTDPGIGNGTAVSVTAATTIDQTFNVAISGLSEGFHRLNIRVRDANGAWSITHSQSFYKSSIPTSLQNIVAMEYFVDNDPGFGNGAPVPITSNSGIDKAFTVDVNALTEGFHRLYVRTRDAGGNWSIAFSQAFYKSGIPTSLQNIVYMEYFVDNDPGFGSATNVPITLNSNIDKIFTVDVNALTEGLHRLFVRTKDAAGNWGVAFSQHFYKSGIPTSLQNIIAMEYFVDTDPGFGNATNVPITQNANVDQLFAVNLTTLTEGFHRIFVRTKDANNAWGQTFSQHFFKSSLPIAPPNLTKLEYYFDSDPGYNNGIAIPLSAAPTLDQVFALDMSSLSNGVHRIFVRARDEKGAWSINFTTIFAKIDAVGAQPNVMALEYFIDTDPELGLATAIPIGQGQMIDIAKIIDVGYLTQANHIIYFRTRDANGAWSLTHPFTFTKNAAVATLDSCSINSQAVVINVYNQVRITLQPNPIRECITGTDSLTVAATGGIGSIIYQWQRSDNNGATWANITGATDLTYRPNNAVADSALYRVIASTVGVACTVDTSRAVLVVINARPVTLVAANNTTICIDGTAILNATLTDGSNSCTIQWQRSTDGATWANIAGAIGTTYNTPQLNNTTRYRTVLNCTASGCCN